MDPDVAVPYALGLVMLFGALIPDLRTRRVPNIWWLPFLVAAVVLLVGELASDPDWPVLGVAVLLVAAFYGMWRLHLFGGADAKALMVLALLAPHPARGQAIPVPPALDALANGTLTLVLLPLLFLLYNAAKRAWSPVMWLGIQMPLDAAQARHVWPMQYVDDAGRMRWRFWQAIGMDQATTYASLRRAGLTRVWATPKIPLIGALLVGLALSWWIGNLLVRGAAALLL